MDHRIFLPTAVRPSDHDSRGMAGWSPERRFRYFRSKMCGLLLFQQDGRSLLEELKRVAQALMDGLASRYETRYAQLCSSNRGLELAALQLITTPSGPGQGDHPIVRQDDVQVLTETDKPVRKQLTWAIEDALKSNILCIDADWISVYLKFNRLILQSIYI